MLPRPPRRRARSGRRNRDAGTAGLLFVAGMRRSEVSALRWAVVADAAAIAGIVATLRTEPLAKLLGCGSGLFAGGGEILRLARPASRSLRLQDARTFWPCSRSSPCGPTYL